MFAGAFKNDSGLVKLFELISAKHEYDEDELRSKSGIKNIAEGRSSLRVLLFKAMRNYHEDSSVRQQLRDAMSNIEFLERKKQKDQALKEIKKAIKIAEQHDEFLLHSILLEKLSRNIDTSVKPAQLFTNLQQILETLELNMSEGLGSLRGRMISAELTAVINSADFTSPEQIKMKSGELKARILELLPSVKTPFTRIYLLTMFIFCDDEGIASRPYLQEVMALYEQNPALIKREPLMYWTFLTTYIRWLHASKDELETVADLLNKMDILLVEHRDFFSSNAQKLLRMKRKMIALKLRFYGAHKMWHSLNIIEEQVKEDLAAVDEAPDTLRAVNVCSLLMGFYDTCQYQKLLEWVQIFYSQPESNHRKPLMISARVFEAFAFYRLKQFDIGITLATNIYKTISEQQHTDTYHKNIGMTLRKLFKWDVRKPADRHEIEALAASFESLKQENDLHYHTYGALICPEDMLRGLLH